MSISTDIDVTRLMFKTLPLLETMVGFAATPRRVALAIQQGSEDPAVVAAAEAQLEASDRATLQDFVALSGLKPDDPVPLATPRDDAWMFVQGKIELIFDGCLVVAPGMQDVSAANFDPRTMLLPAVRLRVATPTFDTYSNIFAELQAGMAPPVEAFEAPNSWDVWSEDGLQQAVAAFRRTVRTIGWQFR